MNLLPLALWQSESANWSHVKPAPPKLGWFRTESTCHSAHPALLHAQKAEIVYGSPTPKLLCTEAITQIISLVEADVSSNWLGMFTGWRKDKVAQWFKISFCLPLLESYSQHAASPLCGRENKIKEIYTKSCNSRLKYCFLTSLFCQSHSTALTLELGQTQERNKVAWI